MAIDLYTSQEEAPLPAQTEIISSKTQETQAKVLVALQALQRVYGPTVSVAKASRIGRLAGISQHQAAAALTLLADKGLVRRSTLAGRRWMLTDAGRAAEVK